MLTMCSKLFHPKRPQPSIWWFLHLKPFIGLGSFMLANPSTSDLPLHLTLHAQRLTIIMRRQSNCPCILWQWVSGGSCVNACDTTNMSIVLNPREKIQYFKKHWSLELQEDIIKCAEEVVCNIYCRWVAVCWFKYSLRNDICSSVAIQTPRQLQRPKSQRGVRTLLCELNNNKANITETSPDNLEDPDWPWAQHFHAYLDILKQVPNGWSSIKWWGVSHKHPSYYSDGS